MHCPFCNHIESIVKDSRLSDDGGTIRRRRECPSCQARFTTYEKVHFKDIFVLKRSGDKEFFDRDKLKASLKMSLRKRDIRPDVVDKTVADITHDLHQLNVTEITSKDVGELVLQYLKKLDKVAFVRFASVYKNFANTQDFENFLKNNDLVKNH